MDPRGRSRQRQTLSGGGHGVVGEYVEPLRIQRQFDVGMAQPYTGKILDHHPRHEAGRLRGHPRLCRRRRRRLRHQGREHVVARTRMGTRYSHRRQYQSRWRRVWFRQLPRLLLPRAAGQSPNPPARPQRLQRHRWLWRHYVLFHDGRQSELGTRLVLRHAPRQRRVFSFPPDDRARWRAARPV